MWRLSKRSKPFVIMFITYLCLHPFIIQSRLYRDILNLYQVTNNQVNEFVIKYKAAQNSSQVKEIDFDKTHYQSGFVDDVKCVIAEFKTIKSTICGNYSNKDQEVLEKFLEYVNLDQNWIILDIGSRNGMYSILGAKMNRTVLAVEPFYDNVLEIYKAIQIEKLQDKIILVQNFISEGIDNQKKVNHPETIQSLLANKFKRYPKVKIQVEYDIKTITFDDILYFIPEIRKKQKFFSQTIMKVDMNGLEPYAFSRVYRLFSFLDVKILFMNWDWARFFNDKNRVENILNYFDVLSLKPFDVTTMTPLYSSFSTEGWRQWPNYILWKKKNF